jgi:Na+/melibiose symporter-like transporter
VNIGGAVGPLIASEVRSDFGIEYVLVMSSLTSFLLFIGTFIFFKEPDGGVRSEGKTFGKVFSDMVMVFGNLRFISFLVIFSGFWIMFWQIFYSFPFYITDVLKFERFEVLETVDAWTIIFLSVPITAFAKKLKPITAMTLGFFLATFCWIIIGVWSTVTAAIVGVAPLRSARRRRRPGFTITSGIWRLGIRSDVHGLRSCRSPSVRSRRERSDWRVIALSVPSGGLIR